MNVAIIGEYNESFRPHQATNSAIEHSKKQLQIEFKIEWLSTEFVEHNLEQVLHNYQGFWIAPGSPYKSMNGALNLIQQTRINNIPTLGTCGGFQHMIIEFARNVFNIKEAGHAEYDPYASELVINPLSCKLKGEVLEIEIVDKSSQVYSVYQSEMIKEKYYCDFGLNPKYQSKFDEQGFRIVGSDRHQEARIMELENHPFYIATLFVPQDNSTAENPHELVTSFLRTVAESSK